MGARPPDLSGDLLVQRVTNGLPPAQPAGAPTELPLMVTAATPAVQGSTRPAPANSNKPCDPKGLPGKFQAFVAGPAAVLEPKVGHWAYVMPVATHRVGIARSTLPSSPRRTGAPSSKEDAGGALDPLARSLAVPNVTIGSAMPAASGTPAGAADVSAIEEAVRRVSWGGDRRRGVARIELGGEYAGTAIVIRGEGRDVALRVEVPRGAEARDLPERLVERLEARGLRVTELEIA